MFKKLFILSFFILTGTLVSAAINQSGERKHDFVLVLDELSGEYEIQLIQDKLPSKSGDHMSPLVFGLSSFSLTKKLQASFELLHFHASSFERSALYLLFHSLVFYE